MLSLKVKPVNKFFFIFFLTLLSACSNKPQKINYYSLSFPISHSVVAEQGTRQPLIVVEPVLLAKYLSHENLLLQTDENMFNVALGSHWSENLDVSISRVLINAMQSRLVQYRIEKQNYHWGQKPKYVVRVELTHFHPTYLNETVTAGQFWVFDSNNNLYLKKAFNFVLPLSKDGYLHAVKKLNTSLFDLSEDIVEVIKLPQ